MTIPNGHLLMDRYERLTACKQSQNGKKLLVVGNMRDALAIRVWASKHQIKVTQKTVDKLEDTVEIIFNPEK